MPKKPWKKPVLEVKPKAAKPSEVFAIINTEEYLFATMERVIRLRKQLKEKDGLCLEVLGYAQGFLKVALENLQAWNSRPFPSDVERDNNGKVFIRGHEVYSPKGDTVIDLICAITAGDLLDQIDPATGTMRQGQ